MWKTLDPDVIGLIEPAPLTPLGPYLATRKLIRKGIPIWELPIKTVKEKRLQGAWFFNFYESAFASIPAYALSFIVSLFPSVESEPFIDNLGTVFNTLYPILPPTVLLVLAFTAGWSSLYRKDYTKNKAKMARRAYLYLDGSYGLLPQSLIAVFNTLFWAALFKESLFGMMTFVIVGNLLSWLFFLITNWHTVRVKLFAVNAYGKGNPGPRKKYIISMTFFAILIGGLMMLGLALVSMLVAAFVDSLLPY